MHKTIHESLFKVNILLVIVSIIINIGLARELMLEKQQQSIRNSEETEKIERQVAENTKYITKELEKKYNLAVKEAFTKEELSNAMQRQWEYIISVNGQEIQTNNMYIQPGNVRIMIAEVLRNESVFSQELLQTGSLDKVSDNISLEDLVEVYSTVPYTLKREETEEGTKYYFDLEGVPQETMIILKLSPLITNRLEYKDKIKENQIALITRATKK